MNLNITDQSDFSIEHQIIPNPLPPGYVLRVIFDPTRSSEDPGLFHGSFFRFIDITHDRNEKCTWPEGIIFENKNTGEFLAIRNGQIYYPSQQTEINKLKELQTSMNGKRRVVHITIIGEDFNESGDKE